MSWAIEVNSLNKTFKTKTGFFIRKTKTTIAVEDVSFSVRKGELFGLLGPNGAGKTTTVKMLSTLLLPTRGSATILGLDIVRQTQEVRKTDRVYLWRRTRSLWKAQRHRQSALFR